ncbi:uncharacterized protein KZ484_003241 isoform 2-T2 [Pholidichthys leucotaenia]
MKLSDRIKSCCVALLLTLTSVSAAIQTLSSIKDLKTIISGQNVPTDSLVLLHWFANEVDIGNNDAIQLTFDPNSDDYGSHLYRNSEMLLEPLPRYNRYQYYTLGNINRDILQRLPDHILHPRLEYAGSNRARIIVRLREPNLGRSVSQTIDQVYITQHYGENEYQGSRYDPQHTYRVSINLLRQLRRFPLEEDDINTLIRLRDYYGSNANDSELWQIINRWGSLACLGLLLVIVNQKGHRSHSPIEAAITITADNSESDEESFESNRYSYKENGPSCECIFAVLICSIIGFAIFFLLYGIGT